MTKPYDFWINPDGGSPLGFNLAIDKDHPYQRATAQFRKEQLDSTPTVGDQSLAGWWTRGQLSFHKGAGVKYYEVLDGETIFNRFKDSTGVDPWEPGEVTLAQSSGAITLPSVTDAVGATHGGDPGVLALLTDGTMRFVDSAVGDVVRSWTYDRSIFSITSSGAGTYAATAGSIEGPAASLHTFTQYVKNPHLLSAGNTTQLVAGDANYSVTYSPTGGATSSYGGPSASGLFFQVQFTGLTVGRSYRLRATGVDTGLALKESGVTAVAAGGSVRDYTFVASSTSASFTFEAAGGGSRSISALSFSDAFGQDDPTPYGDPRWAWSGAVAASTQTMTVAAGDLYDLWLPPSGRAWARIWWAKGRIFALDDQGKWYTLSTGGGTASEAGDVFWSPGLGTTGWSLTESAGAVYISRGSDIYAITLDADGLLPTITTPVVAASFPTGETISTIFSYVGRLVACTNLGLRVAVIQSDQSLAYGAHAVEGDFSATARITALRDLAYVVGTADGDSEPSIFTVNMLSEITDLQPVWVKLAPMSAGTLFGGAITPDGRLMAWDGAGFYRTGDGLQTAGYVTTGFHRLGTLDLKSFQYLRVKTEGSVGSVLVEALLPDGTEATVGTVASGSSEDLSLATAVPTPVEYVAFRFTLTGDGADGPTLLGYQLKALPMPKRQRMIRVPLLLRDRETNRTGQQVVADPWDRVVALEALEASNAVVSFRDDETGETGDAYIEAVEVERTNPPARGPGGFGGYVWLTLRKTSA